MHASLHHRNAREWFAPTLEAKQLVYPIFVCDRESGGDSEIKGFAPNKQWGSLNLFASLVKHLKELEAKGLKAVMLFGVVSDEKKDANGNMALDESTPVIKALDVLKKELPGLLLMADVCLCEYTSHGHCGFENHRHPDVDVDNDASVTFLAQVALKYAKHGAHWVCPSDMMDGRVREIRNVLDANDFKHVGILAYTSKKASLMYAPFRAAVDSTFTGNREQYQHPVGSTLHAMQALERDTKEGATAVLVKPALFYADIIKQFADTSNLPVFCYVVSGEYVMLKQYGDQIDDLKSVVLESHLSMLRAGAKVIVTYFTPLLLDNQ